MKTIEKYPISTTDKLEKKVSIAIQAIKSFIKSNRVHSEYKQVFKSYVLYEILRELEEIENEEKFLSSERRIDDLINRATDEIEG